MQVATQVAEVKTLEVTGKNRMLTPQRMQLAESWRRDFVAVVEHGTPFEAVLDPAFWALVCNEFTPLDRIEVRVDSGEWLAELIVLAVDRTWCKVHLLHHYELAQTATSEGAAPRHRIDFKGPVKKHTVIRIADGANVQDGFSTRAEANTWLSQYERTTAPQ